MRKKQSRKILSVLVLLCVGPIFGKVFSEHPALSSKKSVLEYLDSTIQSRTCEDIFREIAGDTSVFNNDSCTNEGKMIFDEWRLIKKQSGNLKAVYRQNRF